MTLYIKISEKILKLNKLESNEDYSVDSKLIQVVRLGRAGQEVITGEGSERTVFLLPAQKLFVMRHQEFITAYYVQSIMLGN